MHPSDARSDQELIADANAGDAVAFETLYLRYRGEKRVSGEKSWETTVLEGFARLRQAGLIHPLMDEIEALIQRKFDEE